MNENEIKDTLRTFICKELIRNPAYPLEDDQALITGGLIDSYFPGTDRSVHGGRLPCQNSRHRVYRRKYGHAFQNGGPDHAGNGINGKKRKHELYVPDQASR